MKRLFVLILVVLFGFQSFSQTAKTVKKPIQLSGVVVAGDSLIPVKDASIKIVKTDSIDYSYFFNVLTDDKGFFILMAKPGDILEFKKTGYVNSRYTIPDTLTKATTSIVQILQSTAILKDTTQLPEVLPKK